MAEVEDPRHPDFGAIVTMEVPERRLRRWAGLMLSAPDGFASYSGGGVVTWTETGLPPPRLIPSS